MYKTTFNNNCFRFIIILLCVVGNCGTVRAQYDLNIPENDSFVIAQLDDKSTLYNDDNAVILYHKESVDFSQKDENYLTDQSMKYTIQKLIKINDINALDEISNISLPFSRDFVLKKFSVITYKMQNGKLVALKFDKKDMIKEKIQGQSKILKLSLPAVTNGMLIYITFSYAFDINPWSKGYVNIPWYTQKKYPVINSYFEIVIPKGLPNKEIYKNTHFEQCSSSNEFEMNPNGKFIKLRAVTAGFNTYEKQHLLWHRKNIAPIKFEEYVSNINNFLESVRVYIVANKDITNVINAQGVPLTWADVNVNEYYSHPSLGGWIFSPHDTLSAYITKIVEKQPGKLDSARSIFNFVRDSIKCTGFSLIDRIWSSRSPKNALLQKKGTISDKNILLSALMRKAGFSAVPVLLSTVSNGKLNTAYYEPEKPNYLICALAINGETFFLDASEQYMKFGVLKPYCYNNTAWLVTEKGAAIDLSPNLLKDKYVCEATLDLQTDTSNYNLLLEQRFGNVASFDFKTDKKTDSVYFKKELENLSSNWPYPSKLISYTVTNIDQTDTNIILKAKFKINIDSFSDITYFSPVFKHFLTKNPFVSQTRKHPIQMGYCSETIYLVKIKLPKGIEIIDYTPSTQFQIENGNASFRSDIQHNPDINTLHMVSSVKIKESEFPAEQYESLRSFFDRVIEEQNKKVILKKIKN